jgi:hypothetical protein
VNVSEWRELLGHDVLLLAWPKGSKGTKRKWGNLTVDSMTPAYLKKLERGNIGVALGEKSGNLVALDVDTDEMIQPFLTANSFLKDTLQTHGARGRVFWIRMAGEYPHATKRLKNDSGEDCGEFRSNGSQSIIHGIHPSGKAYAIVNHAKPVIVEFASIIWPTEITNPPKLETQLPVTATEDTEDTEDTKDTDESEEGAVWLFSVHSVEDALRISTPTMPHQNYRCALVLARAVKAVEAQAGKPFTPEQHRDIHNQWLIRAAQFLRPGQTKEDYFMEYLNAYKLAKYPLGSVVMAQAIEAAKKNPLPPDMLTWTDNPDVRLLAAICRELQSMAGNEPFYLSARTVQNIFKHDTHATGAKWLRSFCVMQILDEVEKGKGMRASRYRFKFQ